MLWLGMCGFEVLVGRLGGEIIDVGRPVKTVGQAAKSVGLGLRQIVKSLVFVLEDGGALLVVVDGESKVDLEKLKKVFGFVRLAKPDEVKAFTGFEVGGVPPVGINVKTVVDRRVLENRFVYGGGGDTCKLLKIDPKKIVEYQKAKVMDVRED